MLNKLQIIFFSILLTSCTTTEKVKTIIQSRNLTNSENQKEYVKKDTNLSTIAIRLLNNENINKTTLLTHIQIIFKNNSRNPMTIDNVFLEYMNKKGEIVLFQNKTAKFNYNRILSESFIFDKTIKIKQIKYEQSYILPGDTVTFRTKFDRIPYRIRNFKLKIDLNSFRTKKTIAFDLRKFQYRIN